jgi:hypothetical protein
MSLKAKIIGRELMQLYGGLCQRKHEKQRTVSDAVNSSL